MTRFNKSLLAAALGVALAPVAQTAHAEVSANIGVTSNYIWRGVTQTNEDPAVSGGIDYAHDSGFYVGTWTSNVDFADYEWDIYGGYGGNLTDDVSFDINTIYYAYDDACGDCNFWEIGGSLSFSFFTAGLQYTVDGEADEDLPFSDSDLYYYASASFDIAPTWTLGLTLGHYDFDADNDDDLDYTHYQVDIGKSVGDFGDFTFSFGAVDDEDSIAGNDDLNVWVSWGKTF
jgi:uncharacterized protein (TIGR02001 family)